MADRINPETVPTTVVVVEKSFDYLMQRVSGHGEALRIEINHQAVMEAAADSGLKPDDALSVGLACRDNKPYLTVSTEGLDQPIDCIIANTKLLGSKERAQAAIQTGILLNFLNLAVSHNEYVPNELLKRMTPPLSERLKRGSKTVGGFAASVAGSEAILNTVAAGSPQLVRTVSAMAIGLLVYKELSERLPPAVHREKDVIEGYPPFINFHIDPLQK